MNDARLFQAFFASLAGGQWRVGVEDQLRLRRLFSVRHDWDLDTIRVALAAVLVHDPVERRNFDHQFRKFFAELPSDVAFTDEQLLGVLDDLRALSQSTRDVEPNPSTVADVNQEIASHTPPPNAARTRKTWQRRANAALVLSLVAVLVTVVMTRQKPPTPPSPPRPPVTPSKSEPLPAFNPAALVLDLPAGGQTTNRSVSLKLPKDATADRVVEKIEVRQPDSKQGRVNLDREVENATLKPGAELTLPLSITAADSTGSGGSTDATSSSKDGNWSASLVAHIAGESRPVELAVYADRKPSWRPDPWRELAETVPSGQLVIEQRPLERSRAWLGWLVFGCVVALAGYAHWRAVRHSLTIKLDPVPIPPPDPPGRGFSFAKIGGPRRVVVEKKRSRRIADMLGHVAGLDLARTLDLTATIGRTCRSGGWPELAWERRKFTRRVLILEDARIETERKSSAIDDLLSGLRETGVEVEQLWFRRGIRKLVDSRGVEQRLRDLHAARNEYVVLVHTDGSGLTRESERQSLTALAEWPAVAIIDARGSESLASSNDPLAEVTLPKFAADEAGLTRAFRSFAGRLVRGVSSTRDFGPQSSSTRFLQSLAASDGDESLPDRGRSTDGERKLGRRIADVERELELRLGDSLLWAADCVWLQPCSAALAEAVRSEFHGQLPSDRWRRWLDLPNSRIDADGLRFDTPVRTALRAIFKRRRDPGERRLVFESIERQLRESAPEEKNSLAYHVWEAALERFLLETRPGHSPRRLAELKPLVGPYLDESFNGFRIRGDADELDHATPLELELNDLASRQYLAAATDEFKGKLDVTAEPTAEQRMLFSAAVLISLSGFVAALVSGLTTPTQYWRFESPAASEYELRELDSDGKSQTLGRWGREWTATSPAPMAGRQYQVIATSVADEPLTDAKEGRNQSPKQTSPTNANTEAESKAVPADDGVLFVYTKGNAVAVLPTKSASSSISPAWTRFEWIPPGKFLMGSPPDEKGRERDEVLHEVTLTRGFWMAATEVTQRQYELVMGTNPSSFKNSGLDAPVEVVSWEDAVEFCKRLTKHERIAKRLRDEWEFRLPTEAQWEYACRAGSQAAYCFGDDATQLSAYAWFDEGLELGRTHQVASKLPNSFGLYDIHGNVWEWCADRYNELAAVPAQDPRGPDAGRSWVMRGGGCFDFGQACRSACRYEGEPSFRNDYLGFRVVAVRIERALPIAKFGDFEFVEIPPGEFVMGSPESEEGRRDDETQHRVQITNSFFLQRHEVTQRQWREIMGRTLADQAKLGFGGLKGEGDDFPIYHVSWNEAIDFCSRLTELHRKQGTLPKGFAYTLPTEAQWEYACRAGTTTPFGIGDGHNIGSQLANFDGGFPYGEAEKGPDLNATARVGAYASNRWGLFDMHGNVYEWTWDWYGEYREVTAGAAALADPSGPDAGQFRVVRGGSWILNGQGCRSADRDRDGPGSRDNNQGFRVAAVREIELNSRASQQPKVGD